MSIERGKVVSFDATTRRARVRLAGSAPQTLDSVRVSQGIGDGAMVVGHDVIVDLGEQGDPNDAVVVAVYSDAGLTGGEHSGVYLPYSLAVAKGDLLAAQAAGSWSRLAVGVDGANLVADSGAPEGVSWKAGVIQRTTTLVSVASSVTETTAVSFPVGAGNLGTNRMLRLTVFGDYLSNGSGTSTLTLRVKYGATTLWGDVTAANAVDADVRPMRMQFELAALGSATSQRLQGLVLMGNVNSASVAGQGDIGAAETGAWPVAGTSAENSATELSLVVTVQHSLSHANTRFRMHYAVLELI